MHTGNAKMTSGNRQKRKCVEIALAVTSLNIYPKQTHWLGTGVRSVWQNLIWARFGNSLNSVPVAIEHVRPGRPSLCSEKHLASQELPLTWISMEAQEASVSSFCRKFCSACQKASHLPTLIFVSTFKYSFLQTSTTQSCRTLQSLEVWALDLLANYVKW